MTRAHFVIISDLQATTLNPNRDHEPKINRLRQTTENYYCANSDQEFYRANIHTHRDKVISISAPPYYLVGEDDNISKYSSQRLGIYTSSMSIRARDLPLR